VEYSYIDVLLDRLFEVTWSLEDMESLEEYCKGTGSDELDYFGSPRRDTEYYNLCMAMKYVVHIAKDPEKAFDGISGFVELTWETVSKVVDAIYDCLVADLEDVPLHMGRSKHVADWRLGLGR